MARENQGLQISLIIFVMLTVVMSVMTFVFFRKYDDAYSKAREATDHAIKSDAAKEDLASECKDLKHMIGYPPTKSKQEMARQFEEDMKPFAHWPEDVRYYSTINTQLLATLKAKDNEIAARDRKLEQQKMEYAQHEETWKGQIATFEKAATEAGSKLVDVTKEADQGRQETMEQQQKLTAVLDNAKKIMREENEKSKEEIQKLHGTIDQYAGINVTLNRKLGSYTRTYPDRFCGEIRFVNQHEGTVWIDRGWADGLDRQVTFSVYSGDATDLAKAAKKASIEVTKVTDEHVAMARILDDKSTDPIVPGDKLFTPAWAPGEQKHFALVGFLDLNGDGRDDHQGVKNLILLHRGVIDCDVDEKGKRTGEMTVNTNYLIRGETPTEKGQPEVMTAYTHLTTEADRLGVRTISLSDLKEQMGYRNQSPVKRFGAAGPAGAAVPASPKAAASPAAGSTP
jgi:DNA-binding protein H-NS